MQVALHRDSHSSTASHSSFSRAHLYNRSPSSHAARAFFAEQACRHLAENLIVVSGYRPLHMNACALYARFLRQLLELTLKKNFQLLRRQDGNGNSRGLAGLGLDSYASMGIRTVAAFLESCDTPLLCSTYDQSSFNSPEVAAVVQHRPVPANRPSLPILASTEELSAVAQKVSPRSGRFRIDRTVGVQALLAGWNGDRAP